MPVVPPSESGNGDSSAIGATVRDDQRGAVTHVREIDAIEVQDRLESLGAVRLLQLLDCRDAVDANGAVGQALTRR